MRTKREAKAIQKRENLFAILDTELVPRLWANGAGDVGTTVGRFEKLKRLSHILICQCMSRRSICSFLGLS